MTTLTVTIEENPDLEDNELYWFCEYKLFEWRPIPSIEESDIENCGTITSV